MTKTSILVPKGIRYISDWGNYFNRDLRYSLVDYQFPHILDKKIPGCGFTEYCLTNSLNVILCSPRKILLENKLAQHPDEIFYFENDFEVEKAVDVDLTTEYSDKIKNIKRYGGVLSTIETAAERERRNRQEAELKAARMAWLAKKKDQLVEYMNRRSQQLLPSKIIVTYDSFRIVKDILQSFGLLDGFFVVVDEFQSIFTDSRFKSSAELEFAQCLKDIQKLCFVSATPMIDKYLDQIDLFKGLPYYEFDWFTDDPLRVIKPELTIRSVTSLTRAAVSIILESLSGNYPTLLNCKGELIQSKEVVFYVNSINNIVRIIKKAALSPENCNILCAKTKDNLYRLKNKLGKEWEIGSVPLKGEQHKMFTFCTRTVYLGADFYSTNARTVILSDANIESLAVDITLDLPQILGRQRLDINPWKHRALLYYISSNKINELTEEDFNAHIEKKISNTEQLLNISSSVQTPQQFHILAEKYERDAAGSKYRTDYVAVNRHAGSDLIPVFNNLVMVSEKRAFDIQQIDYKDRFTVFSSVQSLYTGDNVSDTVNKLKTFLDSFNEQPLPSKRLQYLCVNRGLLSEEEMAFILLQVPERYQKYYYGIGPDRCKALGYNITRLDKELADRFNLGGEKEIEPVVNNTDEDLNSLIENDIKSTFSVGQWYSLPDIKSKLRDIFVKNGRSSKPSATLLSSYFDINLAKRTVGGVRKNGFEILSIKQ